MSQRKKKKDVKVRGNKDKRKRILSLAFYSSSNLNHTYSVYTYICYCKKNMKYQTFSIIQNCYIEFTGSIMIHAYWDVWVFIFILRNIYMFQ